jgi:hypothetical protein
MIERSIIEHDKDSKNDMYCGKCKKRYNYLTKHKEGWLCNQCSEK